MNDIGLNIKELRKERKLTQLEFSTRIGIDNSQLSKIEQGKLMPTLNQLMEISSIFNISLDWLTGKGPMLKESTPEDKQSKLQKLREIADTPTKKNNLIPFYDDVATIGGKNNIIADTSGISTPSDYIDAGDWFSGVTAAIRHYGDSMSEYPNGCILALRQLHDSNSIVWGRNYVVETNEIRVTKRLQTCKGDDECVMAYSTNTETYPDGQLVHEPFKIRKEDIRRVFMVLGRVVKEYSSDPIFAMKK